jgi:lysozyme
VEPLLVVLCLIKAFEGCRLKAYQDGGGVWSIGYGETLGVVEGMVWTKEEVTERLNARLAYFLRNVYLKCPQLFLEPSERVAACVSLAYNIGLGAFGASSVCRYTRNREYEKASKSFLLWDKDNGKVVKGLTNRRIKERELYDS